MTAPHIPIVYDSPRLKVRIPNMPITGPTILVKNRWVPEGLSHRLKSYNPRTDLGRIVKDCFSHLPAEQAATLLDQIERLVVLESSLSVVVYRGDGSVEDRGVVSRKVITTAGVGYLVDAWQNAVELENMKFHGFGSGTTVEGAAQTGLVTEFTTEYASDNVRPTGSTTEGAGANVLRTIADFAPSENCSVEEQGILSSATVGAGVLWDRSLTGTIDMTGGADSLEATYDMTASSGG